MASQQPRPSWFRFPFMFRPASPAPVPAPASPTTQPSAPRAPPSPQPQPALVRPAPPPVASPPPAAAPAAPNTRPSAPRTSPPLRPQPTWVRPAPPAPVASPPPTVAPAPPSPVPSVPRFQTATPPPRSPVPPSTAPPRSPIPPPPAPVASHPISPATLAPLPPSISRSPVASTTVSPPPRSTAASPTKYPIVKTSASLPPSTAPEESRKTVPFLSSGSASPKTPSPSMQTPVLQKSKLHSPTPIARNASATGSPPEVVKTSVQSTPIKHVSRPPSPSMPSLPQTKIATDHEPKITVISNGKREPTKDKHSESEEYRMRVIKLAGQNKGATMELRASGPQSLDKNGEIKTWRINGEKSITVEGKSVEDKTCDEMFMESPQMTAFMNSNVQGINNSIFYNCSSTHNDPGIHLSLSRKKDQRREWD